MNERYLLNELENNGYLIGNPNKFFREVRAVGLERLIKEINTYLDKATNTRDYNDFEEDIARFLRAVRGLVVNDENYSKVESSTLSAITRTIREIGDKYIISNNNAEELISVNENITSVKNDLAELNKSLEEKEEEIKDKNRILGDLRREIKNISDDTSMTNIDRTRRTFEIMEEMPKIQKEISRLQNEVNGIKEKIAANEETIASLNTYLDSLKNPAIPIINKDFNDEFLQDINNISNLINNSVLSDSTKNEIRKISANLVAMANLPFTNNEVGARSLNELLERIGLVKTTKELKPIIIEEQVIEYEPQESHNDLIDDSQEIENDFVEETPLIEIPIEEEKDEFDDLIQVFNKDTLPKSQPIVVDDSELKEKIKAFNEDNESGQIPIEDESQEIESVDDIVVPIEEVKDSPDKALTTEEIVTKFENLFGTPSNEEKIEQVVSHENDDEKVSEEKEEQNETIPYQVGDEVEIIFNKDELTDDEWNYANEVYLKKGLVNGKSYIISKVNNDGSVEFEGIDGKFPVFIAKGVINNNEEIKEEPQKVNKKKSPYQVGDEVVYFDRINVTLDELAYYQEEFINRGIEKSKKYKVIKVNDDGTIELEGLNGKFKTEGFMLGQIYDQSEEIRKRNLEANKRAHKPKVFNNGDLIEYVGRDNGRLINGHKYKIELLMADSVLLSDSDGNQMVIDFDKNLFELSNEKVVEEPQKENKNDEIDFDEDLSEVINVEKITKLEKIGNKLVIYGICGIVGTIFALPLLGAADAAILLSTIGISLSGVITKSKFVKSFVASSMYKKVKKLLKVKEEEIKEEDLSVDELAELKYNIDILNGHLNEIERTSAEKDINYKMF